MTQTLPSVCPLDCPDSCSLSVTVDAGTIISVDAAPIGEATNPTTNGFICQKVKHHAERVYSPERVQTPLIRTGPKGAGEFRSVSWNEAIELVGSKMRSAIADHGAQAIVPFLYGSSSPSTQAILGDRLWRRVGASRVDHTICAATSFYAYLSVYGAMLSSENDDVLHSDVIVVWGANPTVANVHFPPLVARAQRERNAILVVIDPRRTGMAKRCDLHLAIRPGTDVVLALAVARELEQRGALATDFLAEHAIGVNEYLAAAQPYDLEAAANICGLDLADILSFIDLLIGNRNVMYRVGWGLERNRNGGSACAAVFALPALLGHFGQRGRGIISSTGAASPIAVQYHDNDRRRFPTRPRHFNMNDFGAKLCDETLDPPISVLFVQSSNLAATNPDQTAVLRGLAREDLFTVVHDQVLTDTARFADVVLPATTHFETHDFVDSYGSYTVQELLPVIERVGQSRSDNEVSALLAVALGEPAEEFDPSPQAVFASATNEGAPETAATRIAGETVQFVDTFPTHAGGKIQLASLIGLGVPRFVELDSPHEFTLLSPASSKTINSMFAEFQDLDPSLRVHPDDAARIGVVTGTRVRVFNDQAEVFTTARIDDDLKPGVVLMPKGIWCRSYENGLTVNALVPNSFSDMADGACFNDARVSIAPVR